MVRVSAILSAGIFMPTLLAIPRATAAVPYAATDAERIASGDTRGNIREFLSSNLGSWLEKIANSGRVAGELCIRHPRAEIAELIRANTDRREKIVRAGRANDVVVIHTITADADGADQLSISIKRETTRENRDAVWEARIVRHAGTKHDIRHRLANKASEEFLQTVVRPGILHVESRRIMRLRKEADGARRFRECVR